MTKSRLIAVVIVRDGRVVQSEKFKHNHVIHYDALHAIESFSRWDIDEIVILNVSLNKNTQKHFADIVEKVSSVCWVPLTAGGFIDSLNYGSELIRRGADKLIINSAFHEEPSVPLELSNKFGKQCIVASIDVRTSFGSKPIVWVNRARKSTNIDLAEWVNRCEANGAGEVFLNNIEFDGNRKGFDLSSLKIVVNSTRLPIVIFGGAFLNKHFAEGLDIGASAVAAANIFHYKEMATKQVKRYLLKNGYNVRSL